MGQSERWMCSDGDVFPTRTAAVTHLWFTDPENTGHHWVQRLPDGEREFVEPAPGKVSPSPTDAEIIGLGEALAEAVDQLLEALANSVVHDRAAEVARFTIALREAWAAWDRAMIDRLDSVIQEDFS